MSSENILPLACGMYFVPFFFLILFFTEQKLLILMKSSLSIASFLDYVLGI